MSHWDLELLVFAEANRRVSRAEELISGQKALIERMTAEGKDTTGSEELLAVYTTLLETAQNHRESVLQEMNFGSSPTLLT